MKRDEFWKDRLNVAIGLGLCCLPLIFFVAVVFFDIRTAWLSVVVAFVLILVVCNAICRFPPDREVKRNGN